MGARNEMEFLGNDRYFKYRYSQETVINYSIPFYSLFIDRKRAVCNFMADYLKRSLNMKVSFEKHAVDNQDLSKLYTKPHVFNRAHFFMLNTPRLFFGGRLDHFTPSLPSGTTKLVIASSAPKKAISTSLSFLNIDTDVLILVVSSLVLLSLLLFIHSIVTNKYKSLTTKTIVKKFAKETLENVWENASLLCAEPIPTILPNITCRLLALSWLIGVTFILFFLGCYLCTEFTSETYTYIDTLSDLIKSGIAPTMLVGSGTFEYLQVLADQDPVVKGWLEGLDKQKIFSDEYSYAVYDGYFPILSGEKALIITREQLNFLMAQQFNLFDESKDFFMERGGLYLSQEELGFDYLHSIFNTSWLRSTPHVDESIKLSLAPLFETQVFKYLDFESLYPIENVLWKKPMKSAADLNLSSVIVPFYFLFTLLSGTVAIAITEIIFNRFS